MLYTSVCVTGHFYMNVLNDIIFSWESNCNECLEGPRSFIYPLILQKVKKLRNQLFQLVRFSIAKEGITVSKRRYPCIWVFFLPSENTCSLLFWSMFLPKVMYQKLRTQKSIQVVPVKQPSKFQMKEVLFSSDRTTLSLRGSILSVQGVIYQPIPKSQPRVNLVIQQAIY